MSDDSELTAGRHETPVERYDRNWDELLQEFRVLQTGTQILAGFLLVLPFQQRFDMLSAFDEGVYLALMLLAVCVTLLALTPVSLHRLLFRHAAKRQLVEAANKLLIIALCGAAVLFTGIVLFVVDVVVGQLVGLVAASGVLAALLVLWLVLPIVLRRRARREADAD